MLSREKNMVGEIFVFLGFLDRFFHLHRIWRSPQNLHGECTVSRLSESVRIKSAPFSIVSITYSGQTQPRIIPHNPCTRFQRFRGLWYLHRMWRSPQKIRKSQKWEFSKSKGNHISILYQSVRISVAAVWGVDSCPEKRDTVFWND